jgi:hypothetical protein
MSNKVDRRKLKIKKPIITTTFNERDESFAVELGEDITSDQVFAALVFQVETLAEATGIDRDKAWIQLNIYWKGRVTK